LRECLQLDFLPTLLFSPMLLPPQMLHEICPSYSLNDRSSCSCTLSTAALTPKSPCSRSATMCEPRSCGLEMYDNVAFGSFSSTDAHCRDASHSARWVECQRGTLSTARSDILHGKKAFGCCGDGVDGAGRMSVKYLRSSVQERCFSTMAEPICKLGMGS
jgi:hypothetical protein